MSHRERANDAFSAMRCNTYVPASPDIASAFFRHGFISACRQAWLAPGDAGWLT